MSSTMPKARVPMQAAIILLGLAVTFSVALDNLLLGILLILGLIGTGRHCVVTVLRNPIARAAWMLFGLLLLASCYGQASWRESMAVLGKYIDLALIPIFMIAASVGKTKTRAIHAFMLGMAVTLAISTMLGLGIIGSQPWMLLGAASANPVVFHSSITQNLLLGYAAFLALLAARDAIVVWQRFAWRLFAVLASLNILLLGMGRTGYLVLFALLVRYFWGLLSDYMRVKGIRMGAAAVAVVSLLALLAAWGAYQLPGRLHDRVDQVISEYRAWQPNVANRISNASSTGARLEFYYNTLQIVRDHPLFGVGTGGFPAAYAQQVAGTGIMPTHNPHNEYLLLTVQAGLPALVLMLYWLYVQWREAAYLDRFGRDAARGLVLTIAISCMVNSSLLDHTEGLFFAFMSALLFAGLRHAQEAHHG